MGIVDVELDGWKRFATSAWFLLCPLTMYLFLRNDDLPGDGDGFVVFPMAWRLGAVPIIENDG
jgi:hypothetical protein